MIIHVSYNDTWMQPKYDLSTTWSNSQTKHYIRALDGYASTILTKKQYKLYFLIKKGYRVGSKELDEKMGYRDSKSVYRIYNRIIERLKRKYKNANTNTT